MIVSRCDYSFFPMFWASGLLIHAPLRSVAFVSPLRLGSQPLEAPYAGSRTFWYLRSAGCDSMWSKTKFPFGWLGDFSFYAVGSMEWCFVEFFSFLRIAALFEFGLVFVFVAPLSPCEFASRWCFRVDCHFVLSVGFGSWACFVLLLLFNLRLSTLSSLVCRY